MAATRARTSMAAHLRTVRASWSRLRQLSPTPLAPTRSESGSHREHLQRHRRDRARADLRRAAGRAEPLGLLYLHILESPDTDFHEPLRKQWDGTVMYNTGFTGPSDLAPHRRPSTPASPTCSASDAASWPTLISSSACAWAPSSTSRHGDLLQRRGEGLHDYPFCQRDAGSRSASWAAPRHPR